MIWPFNKKEDRAVLATPTTWLFNSLTGGKSASGISVNTTSALSYSAVYAAVRLLSESVASLPLHTYERIGEGKQRSRSHPVANVLSTKPNDQLTSFSFRETLMGHVLTWGNGYAEIVRDGAGTATALLPVTPDRVRVTQDTDATVRYVVDEQITLEQDSMFHIAGLGFDGLIGYSPITLAKDCIGLGMAAERFGGSFFQNSARPAGVLVHPGKLSQEAAERLRESWTNTMASSQNAGKTAILEEGMNWVNLGIPPDDAQYLETRKFQVDEIARWYGIPPHMIASMDSATFSNIEHQAIEFVTHTLRPWLVRWEQEISRKLFMNDDYFPQFVVDGLLRGDTKTRYESYRVARESGWLSVNEIRALENLNPVEGGDQYVQPLNMGTVTEDVVEEEDRSWMAPLLEDALNRAKRVQDNKERQARDRKGIHFDEWRSNWINSELLPLFCEIIEPAMEAITRSSGWHEHDHSAYLLNVVDEWMNTDEDVTRFTERVLEKING